MRTSGNAEIEKTAEKMPRFELGDIVSLTAAALRRKKLSNMTPRLLYEIGHPNEFLVLEVFDHAIDGPCIALSCCTRQLDENGKPIIRFVDRKNGKMRCNGHQVSHFEKKSYKRLPKKGDKSTSLHIPFLPFELAGVHWEDDEQNPAFKVSVAGKEVGVTGALAKFLKNVAEENGII